MKQLEREEVRETPTNVLSCYLNLLQASEVESLLNVCLVITIFKPQLMKGRQIRNWHI